MKKLIFVLSLIGIISTGYGQKISTLVEDGDTIETLTNDSYISLSELDGTPTVTSDNYWISNDGVLVTTGL